MASIAEILALVNSDPVSARTLRAVLEFVLSRNIETDHLAFDHGNLAGLSDDDHTQYQKESEKDQASGYAGLGATTLLDREQLPQADTTQIGAVELATDGEAIANVVVQGNDARLSNTRTPTAHASTHQNGGTDEVATATAAANAIPKAGAGGELDEGWIPTLPGAAIACNFRGNSVPASSTRYVLGTTITATEADAEFLCPFTGVLRNCYFRATSSQPGDGKMNVIVRKNAANTLIDPAIQQGDPAGTYGEAGTEVAVTAGDRIAISLVNLSASPSATIAGIGLEIAYG